MGIYFGIELTGDSALLWRAIETSATPAGDLWDDCICQHVDAQHGDGSDDDASGHRNTAAAAVRHLCPPRHHTLLQSSGAGSHILGSSWWHEHPDGYRREPYLGGYVAVLLP